MTPALWYTEHQNRQYHYRDRSEYQEWAEFAPTGADAIDHTTSKDISKGIEDTHAQQNSASSGSLSQRSSLSGMF